MKNATEKIFVSILAFALCAILSVTLLCGIKPAFADTDEQTVYCIDGTYSGTGTQTSATYDIPCDNYEIIDGAVHTKPPSFGNGDSSMSNTCGPLAGMNIVTFFDRWCTELVPNYDPGVMFSSGYQYWSDRYLSQTKNAIRTLYDLMNTGELGGTTSVSFKNGLKTYIENAGYNVSTSSFYSNPTTVSLSKLKTAINQNKVGLIMCERFDYVSHIIISNSDSLARIVKVHYDAAHIMMVTGYETVAFYKDGVTVATETFLRVSSSFNTGETGYVQLNDSYLNIDEALIYTIQ